MSRFHINKNGIPALCRARPGNCPLGGDEKHFKTKEEAQAEADNKNEAEFGILLMDKNEIQPRLKEFTHKKAVTERDMKFIERRIKEIKRQDNQNYTDRCRRTERLDEYTPNNEETFHYREERANRENQLVNEFGVGEVVGYYKVNHLIGQDNPRYRDQIVEVKDTGQIKIYDVYTGRTVTTFMAHRQRIEVMMLQAGEMPQERWKEGK